jgi:cell cycle checkpoint control protein RAD9A
MTKTYRLTYEAAEVMHALFDRTAATQGWRISSRVMREYIEYFGPKTEQLDIQAQAGKIIFTSYTEKIQDGKEVLKQPLETVITLHTEDFDDFHMQEDMHITISVKDFKAIVTHAETLHTPMSAHFSLPTRPLQFGYQSEGMLCQFTLMTMGDFRGASSTPSPKFISTRSTSRQTSAAPVQEPSRSASEMPPPRRPASKMMVEKPLSSQSQRKSLRPEKHQPVTIDLDADEESLFMPPGDDDQTWAPADYEADEEEEFVGWDGNNAARNAAPHPTFRDSGTASSASFRQQPVPAKATPDDAGLEPTQRLSQVRSYSFLVLTSPS